MITDLQKFKDLLDEMGIKYQIDVHGNNIKELGIYSEHLYADWRGNVNNAVSIVFDSNDKFMYFEGMSCR